MADNETETWAEPLYRADAKLNVKDAEIKTYLQRVGVEGRKDDTGKLRFDLLPVKPLMKVAEVYTIGATKYADRNWEKGLKWGRVFAAMMRHAWKWWGGERNDPVDGQHHLSSVVWCALALMEYEETCPQLDDRPTSKPTGPVTQT